MDVLTLMFIHLALIVTSQAQKRVRKASRSKDTPEDQESEEDPDRQHKDELYAEEPSRRGRGRGKGRGRGRGRKEKQDRSKERKKDIPKDPKVDMKGDKDLKQDAKDDKDMKKDAKADQEMKVPEQEPKRKRNTPKPKAESSKLKGTPKKTGCGTRDEEEKEDKDGTKSPCQATPTKRPKHGHNTPLKGRSPQAIQAALQNAQDSQSQERKMAQAQCRASNKDCPTKIIYACVKFALLCVCKYIDLKMIIYIYIIYMHVN